MCSAGGSCVCVDGSWVHITPNSRQTIRCFLRASLRDCDVHIVPQEPIPKWFVDCNSVISVVVHD